MSDHKPCCICCTKLKDKELKLIAEIMRGSMMEREYKKLMEKSDGANDD